MYSQVAVASRRGRRGQSRAAAAAAGWSAGGGGVVGWRRDGRGGSGEELWVPLKSSLINWFRVKGKTAVINNIFTVAIQQCSRIQTHSDDSQTKWFRTFPNGFSVHIIINAFKGYNRNKNIFSAPDTTTTTKKTIKKKKRRPKRRPLRRWHECVHQGSGSQSVIMVLVLGGHHG